MKTYLIFYLVFVHLLYSVFLTSELSAQTLDIERIMVLTAEEASDAGYPMHFLEIAFLKDSVPDDYLMVVHKFTGDVNPPTIPLDTVMIGDLPDNKWYDNNPATNTGSERYFLVLLDDSGVIRLAATESHGSIYLKRPVVDDIDRCSGHINIRWDNYSVRETIGVGAEMTPFFTHNRIWVMEPGANDFTMVGEVPFSVTEFDGYVLDVPGYYQFRIQSVEIVNETEMRTSFSNIQAAEYLRPIIHSLDIRSVDVQITNIVTRFSASTTIAWSPGEEEVFDYDVYRSETASGPFVPLGGGVRDGASGYFSYTDTTVPDLSVGPYFYKVVARLEGCDEGYGLESAPVSSLFLDGNIDVFDDFQLTISLSWEQDPRMPDYYLFRRLPDEDDFMQVLTTSAFSYTDDLSAYLETLAGEVFYRLQASDGTVLVHSNEISVIIETGLFIPTAFRPGSSFTENQHFRPGFTGQIPRFYQLTMYNRWGQEMFSVVDPGNDWPGWNGEDSEGRDVQQGVYGYRFEYQIGSGPREEIMGTVMLLR